MGKKNKGEGRKGMGEGVMASPFVIKGLVGCDVNRQNRYFCVK